MATWTSAGRHEKEIGREEKPRQRLLDFFSGCGGNSGKPTTNLHRDSAQRPFLFPTNLRYGGGKSERQIFGTIRSCWLFSGLQIQFPVMKLKLGLRCCALMEIMIRRVFDGSLASRQFPFNNSTSTLGQFMMHLNWFDSDGPMQGLESSLRGLAKRLGKHAWRKHVLSQSLVIFVYNR